VKIKAPIALLLFDLRQSMPVLPGIKQLPENPPRGTLLQSGMRYRESTRKYLCQPRESFPILPAKRALRPLGMILI
jgi:hypothetical protein